MLEIGELMKDGKTKRIYATDDADQAVLYFKDEAIAFHGLKRGLILGKGEVNNSVCEHIFSLLSAEGIPNHYIQRLDVRQSLVRRCSMIPLTVTVRNFAAGSLTQRLGIPSGTALKPRVVEFALRNHMPEHPLVNRTHIEAMGIADQPEMDCMQETALRISELLSRHMSSLGVQLVDLHLRFGRSKGELLVADEISPDTCRFWDAQTQEPLDIDRFREDLGDEARGYRELLHRLMGVEA